ncbi:hypothetical protein QWY81_00470 [Polaribacter undariae]|uniref:Threonine synthase n=1 Tax=Polaribacter sejongensis TaxID=985043 RepID=A0AAJ1VEF2_9FLAO|nr:DUF6503 family protein [Polaribacter undariae]MDN3617921.1 hypothetical protein [Polaribacter undariae]UWD32047.1 hypothetical protein NQP51_18195 [Polaribacter undariae]
MKKVLLLLIVVIAISCKNEPKKEVEKGNIEAVKIENFPEELGKVFKAHGGIDTWRNAEILSFKKGEEVHTINLQSRINVINAPNYAVGFDGKNVWLDEAEEGTFKGNPAFYHNLFFYFYAMPFVLSDEGITYEKIAPLTFDGVDYPGYKMSFKSDMGSSPDDNYKLYFNAETHQMEWLAYTATFMSKKPSDKFNIIKYGKWNNVNGLLLPSEITWYKKDENGVPTEPARPAAVFTDASINKNNLTDSFFEKPIK